jgi:hypothetical protein
MLPLEKGLGAYVVTGIARRIRRPASDGRKSGARPL